MRFTKAVKAGAGMSISARTGWKQSAVGAVAVATSSAAFGAAGAGAQAMTQVATMFSQGATLALTLLGVVVFVVAGYAVVNKMISAASGRGSWGEVFIPFVFAGAALVFVGWIVTAGTAEIAKITVGAAAGG